jgi:MYXO-CTERM domain-containing protein
VPELSRRSVKSDSLLESSHPPYELLPRHASVTDPDPASPRRRRFLTGLGGLLMARLWRRRSVIDRMQQQVFI